MFYAGKAREDTQNSKPFTEIGKDKAREIHTLKLKPKTKPMVYLLNTQKIYPFRFHHLCNCLIDN